MADSDLVNEELDRVYRLYGERTRQFRRGLYGLIVASLAIFVLIVVPFLTFRDQLAEMQASEVALAVELQQARDLVADSNASVQKMRAIWDAVEGFEYRHQDQSLYPSMAQEAAEHTRELEETRRQYSGWADEGVAAWVRGEAKQPPEEFINTDRRLWGLAQKPCYWESGIGYVACQLCQNYTRANERFAGQISRLVAVEAAVLGAAQDDLGALVEGTCGWLTRGEVHFETDEQLPPDGTDMLLRMFPHDISHYAARLGALHGTLRRGLPEGELEVERIERARADTTERLAVLQRQLERIASFDRLGTPIGDLPVGLGQIVLLFPVVLALGFLVVANGFARMADLQRAFVRLCRKRDRTGEVMDDRHVSVIAPLWLDPREPLGARAAKWAIMLTPLALMVANLMLIAMTEALTAQLPDDAAISPAAYLVLYGASLALFAGTLWHVWRSENEPLDTDSAVRPEES